MIDYWSRLLELERRSLRLQSRRFELEQKRAQLQQRINIIASGSYARSSDQFPAVSTAYPWAMSKVWITVTYDTEIIFDPYLATQVKFPQMGYPGQQTFDVYKMASGTKYFCDYKKEWTNNPYPNTQVSYNAAPYPTLTQVAGTRYGPQSNPGNINIGNWSSSQAGADYEIRFNCYWNYANSTFTLAGPIQWSIFRPLNRTLYSPGYGDLWQVGTSEIFHRFDLLVDGVTFGLNESTPQFTSPGSQSFSSTIRIDGVPYSITDYWVTYTNYMGITCPFAPIYPAVPSQHYPIYENQPSLYGGYSVSAPCTILLEWE